MRIQHEEDQLPSDIPAITLHVTQFPLLISLTPGKTRVRASLLVRTQIIHHLAPLHYREYLSVDLIDLPPQNFTMAAGRLDNDTVHPYYFPFPNYP